MPWKQAWPSCATLRPDMEGQRQAHYRAGDAVIKPKASCMPPPPRWASLETEIRYVLEGRQRVAQRLQQLAEQT